MRTLRGSFVGFLLLFVAFIMWKSPPTGARVGSTLPLVIQGHVHLQRPNAPAPATAWEVPLRVDLLFPGQSSPRYQWSVHTDEWGNFSITDIIPVGTYDVCAKNMHTLRNVKRNVYIRTGVNDIDLGLLREGDANDDNAVNVQDFVILRHAYFTEKGSPKLAARADVDADNRINVRDFALLRSNYFAEGDIIVPRFTSEHDAITVTLTVKPSFRVGEPEAPYSFTLELNAPEGIVGADVILRFDPQHLHIVDAQGHVTNAVQAGTTLDVILSNLVDPQAGTIFFGAGTFGSPVQGRFVLFSFYALAPRAVFHTPLEIAYAEVTDENGRALPNRSYYGYFQTGDYPLLYLPELLLRRSYGPQP